MRNSSFIFKSAGIGLITLSVFTVLVVNANSGLQLKKLDSVPGTANERKNLSEKKSNSLNQLATPPTIVVMPVEVFDTATTISQPQSVNIPDDDGNTLYTIPVQ